MKKILVFSILALSYLTSCNKQYICTCTVIGTVEVESYYMYNSKRKALKNCNKVSSSTTSCVLEVY